MAVKCCLKKSMLGMEQIIFSIITCVKHFLALSNVSFRPGACGGAARVSNYFLGVKFKYTVGESISRGVVLGGFSVSKLMECVLLCSFVVLNYTVLSVALTL